MKLFEIFLIGVGLAMDAFAVSICKGLTMKTLRLKPAIIIAFSFGFFQGLMPAIGYFLGSAFSKYIQSFDYIVAFALLALIGGKMIIDSFKKDNEASDIEASADFKLNYKELFVLSVVTSIDALAVGVTFSLENVGILYPIIIISITTFSICLAGVIIGNAFGNKYEKKSQLLGGLILISIGLKMFIEHFI